MRTQHARELGRRAALARKRGDEDTALGFFRRVVRTAAEDPKGRVLLGAFDSGYRTIYGSSSTYNP
jgi:hypothetical protein